MKLAKHLDQPEIFLSVQGEGPSIGLPSVFVRCSLCNLFCVWCDTDYTWNWTGTKFPHVRDAEPEYRKYHKQNEIIELPPPEVAHRVARYRCRNVVLTGGEPLLQQEDCSQLLACLHAIDKHFHVEMETNGTLIPVPELHASVDQYNVSVKLENSGVPSHLRERADAIKFFVGEGGHFKFVVTSRDDIDEIVDLVERHAIPVERVYLMPEGQSSQVVRERSRWLVDVCKTHGFRLSDRLHIHLFGEARGT